MFKYFQTVILLGLFGFIVHISWIIVQHPTTTRLLGQNRTVKLRERQVDHERHLFSQQLHESNVSTFANLTSENSKATIYSAYFDARVTTLNLYGHVLHRERGDDTDSVLGVVRALIIIPKEDVNFKFGENIVCVFNFTNSIRERHHVLVKPVTRLYRRFDHRNFQPTVIICPVYVSHAYHPEDSPLPTHVGILNNASYQFFNLLDVEYRWIVYPKVSFDEKNHFHLVSGIQDFKATHKATICAVPTNWTIYQNIRNLVEFIEYHRILNIDKIYFYIDESQLTNRTRSRLKIISQLYDPRIIVWVEWNIYGYNKKILHENAAVLARLDCLYRSSLYNHDSFVFNLNANEFISLQGFQDVHEFLYDMDLRHPLSWVDPYYVLEVDTVCVSKPNKSRPMNSQNIVYCQNTSNKDDKYLRRPYNLIVAKIGDCVDGSLLDENSEHHNTFEAIPIGSHTAIIRRFMDCELLGKCFNLTEFKPDDKWAPGGLVKRLERNFGRTMGRLITFAANVHGKSPSSNRR